MIILEQLRTFLYYPLGFLPSIFFTLRIVIQWVQSEKLGRSYTGKAFWKLSFFGNLLLLLHYTLQVQYPLALLQASNSVIAWRSLDLMGERSFSKRQTFALFSFVFLLVTGLFLLQGYLTIGGPDWIRTPTKVSGEARVYHSAIWHWIGTFGATLFASRFWVQWWRAERDQNANLSPAFWWISLLGSSICLVYFIKIEDTVSIINYAFGTLPYIRNIMLSHRSSLKS